MEKTTEITTETTIETPIEQKVKKPKKKIKKKWIVLGVLAVVVVGGIVASSLMGGKNTGIPVIVVDANEGDVKEIVDISGTVASEEVTTYFAEVNAKIAELNVENGSEVRSGESLVVYDTKELEDALTKTTLEAKSSEIGADVVVMGLDESQRKAGEAAKNYDEAVKYVQHFQDCVNQINGQLAEANSLNEQKASIEAEIGALTEQLNAKPDSTKLPKKINEKNKELKEVNRKLKGYDVPALNAALESCSADLSEYKGLEAEYKAGKEAADPTAGKQKEQQSAIKESLKFTKEEVKEELDLAKQGVSAEVTGIVSELQVVKGQTVQAGSPLFTISDSSKVKVTVELTKHNLETVQTGQKAELTINGNSYTGTVANINKVAGTNQAGATVVSADIHIDNPDDKLYLGVDAKVKITVADKKGVLAVPISCVNYGTDSTFCYVVKDGAVAKKEVEIGISSSEYIEIISGLEKGDQVINSLGTEYEEGTPVTPTYE